MKLSCLLFLAVLALGPSARATIIYSGPQNIPIPQTFDGVYLRLDTGAISTTEPANYANEPWVNPFFGGVAIGSTATARPVITGADQVVNLVAGTMIDGGSNFAAAANGSSTHFGSGPSLFEAGVPGYAGFIMQPPAGQPYYLWLSIVVDNASAGRITGWAYNNMAGQGILAGQTAPIPVVPEPGTALFGGVLAMLLASRRVNRRGWARP